MVATVEPHTSRSEHAAEQPSPAEAAPGLEADTLVEEISIDGMCGVY